MNKFHVLAACAVLGLAASHASGQMGGMQPNEMKSMDMDMCKEMMGKEMPRGCKEMMERHGMGMMGMTGEKMAKGQHQGTGVVKKVDASGGKVTLQHDPIQSMGWPKMTMDFAVKDSKALASLKPEQKVEFSFVQQGSDYVITSIK